MSDINMQAILGTAAIGSDGLRPVVWGLGIDGHAALEDAAEQEGAPPAAELRTVDITTERWWAIKAGDVDASDLWV